MTFCELSSLEVEPMDRGKSSYTRHSVWLCVKAYKMSNVWPSAITQYMEAFDDAINIRKHELAFF